MGLRNLTPEETARLVELLPTAISLRGLARDMGVHLDTVRRAAEPFIALMRASGTLTPCDCGKPRFHPYGCAGKFNILHRQSIRPPIADQLMARREMALGMLAQGLLYREVDEALGMSHGCARAYMRFMTPEQCALRNEALKARALKRRVQSPNQVRTAMRARMRRPDKEAMAA